MFDLDKSCYFEFCHFLLNYNLHSVTMAALVTTEWPVANRENKHLVLSDPIAVSVSWNHSKIDVHDE